MRQLSDKEQNELIQAIKDGDLDKIKPFLRDRTLINSFTLTGETPLTLAAKLGNKDVVYTLMCSMALDPEKKDKNDDLAIELAIRSGDKELVKTMLSMGYLTDVDKRVDYIIRAKIDFPAAERCDQPLLNAFVKRAGDIPPEVLTSYQDKLNELKSADDETRGGFEIASLVKQVTDACKDLSFAKIVIDAGILSGASKEEVSEGLAIQDWAYYQFLELDENEGFDMDLYQKHEDEPSSGSDYSKAMSNLIAELKKQGPFKETIFEVIEHTS